MERLAETFEAISDEGDRFIVQRYVDLIDGAPVGLSRLALADGRYVNPTDDPKSFKIVGSNQLIRKVG